MTIQVENVLKVYSGKNGCMCGCNGTYSYATAHQAAGGKDRGYEVSDDELNDNKIKRMVNKFNKNPELYKEGFDKNGKLIYAFIETETRQNCMYFI